MCGFAFEAAVTSSIPENKSTVACLCLSCVLICILLSVYPMASWFHIMEQDELTITRDVIGRCEGGGGGSDNGKTKTSENETMMYYRYCCVHCMVGLLLK